LLEDAETKVRLGSVVDILIVRALAQWRQETHGDALVIAISTVKPHTSSIFWFLRPMYGHQRDDGCMASGRPPP
jgi:hypothetical protein